MKLIRVRLVARKAERAPRPSLGKRPGHFVAHRAASRPAARGIHGRRSRASVFAPVVEAARSLTRWHKIFFPAEFKKRKKQDNIPFRTWEDFNTDLERIYGSGSVASGVPLAVEGAHSAARNEAEKAGIKVANA